MFRIRRYSPEDSDAVWALHFEGLDEMGANVGTGPWEDDLRDIQSAYFDSDGEFLVGTVDGQIVAMGALKKVSPRRAEIKRMRVYPHYRSRGFAEAILKKLEEAAIGLGYQELCLDTTATQIPAQNLYRKHGFKEVRRTVFQGKEMLFFEKQLPREANG